MVAHSASYNLFNISYIIIFGAGELIRWWVNEQI